MNLAKIKPWDRPKKEVDVNKISKIKNRNLSTNKVNFGVKESQHSENEKVVDRFFNCKTPYK